jgi:hypothetical protein
MGISLTELKMQGNKANHPEEQNDEQIQTAPSKDLQERSRWLLDSGDGSDQGNPHNQIPDNGPHSKTIDQHNATLPGILVLC